MFFTKSKSIRSGNASPFKRTINHPNPIKTRRAILKIMRTRLLIRSHSLFDSVRSTGRQHHLYNCNHPTIYNSSFPNLVATGNNVLSGGGASRGDSASVPPLENTQIRAYFGPCDTKPCIEHCAWPVRNKRCLIKSLMTRCTIKLL